MSLCRPLLSRGYHFAQNLQILKIASLCRHHRAGLSFFGASNSPINWPETHVSEHYTGTVCIFRNMGRKNNTILGGEVEVKDFSVRIWNSRTIWCTSLLKLKVSNGWMVWTPNKIRVNYQITVGKIASPILRTMSRQSTWVGGLVSWTVSSDPIYGLH